MDAATEISILTCLTEIKTGQLRQESNQVNIMTKLSEVESKVAGINEQLSRALIEIQEHSITTETAALLAQIAALQDPQLSPGAEARLTELANLAKAIDDLNPVNPVNSVSRFGPQPFVATSLSAGTRFVSPDGTGSGILASDPCSFDAAVSSAVPGDVIFLRGGTYSTSAAITISKIATQAAPIVFESYPGELAVFDGSTMPLGTESGIYITGAFIRVRNIEIRNMPMQGIQILGTDSILDNVHSHHNKLSGIQIYSSESPVADPTLGSRNTIRNCISHDNSDAGLTGHPYQNGGNADGIGVSSGVDNRVEHNLVYRNSDDGIDAWMSVRTYIGYNIVHSQGIADGNGSGIKGGGAAPSKDTIVEFNLVHSNKKVALDSNDGTNITFRNNTARNNGISRRFIPDTIAIDNISPESERWGVTGIETNNSWQRAGTVAFISDDPTSPDYMIPTAACGFHDIGAYK